MTGPDDRSGAGQTPSGSKAIFRRCAEAKRWFAAALVVYAVVIIAVFAAGNASPAAIRIHIAIWTLLPPILFVIEYWAMSPMEEKVFNVFVAEQQIAGRVWAAVLAVLVLTQAPLPLSMPGSGG